MLVSSCEVTNITLRKICNEYTIERFNDIQIGDWFACILTRKSLGIDSDRCTMAHFSMTRKRLRSCRFEDFCADINRGRWACLLDVRLQK